MMQGISAILALLQQRTQKPEVPIPNTPETDHMPLLEGDVRMTMGGGFSKLHPAEAEIAAATEALEQAPESYLSLATHEVWLQAVFVPGEGYVLEWSCPPASELFRCEEAIARADAVEALFDFNAGRDRWKERFQWVEMLPPALTEMDHVELGVFFPRDARRLLDALVEHDLELEMEQTGAQAFRITVPGKIYLEAERLMLRVLDIHV